MITTEIINLKARLQYQITAAMATPLSAPGRVVNSEVIPALVDFLLARGVGGFFVGGTTGEGILLPIAARKKLHEATITAVAGRAPVLLHVGANDTATAADLARHAAQIEADAILILTPYFYGLADEAILTHFTAVAAAAPNTPFLAYDIPHLATNGVSPALVAQLQATVPSFAGVKCSRPDAQHIRRLADQAPDHILLVGNERILLGSMALGATGTINGLSTALPEPFVALMQAWKNENHAEALKWQRVINQLLDLLPAGARIGGIKAITTARGIDVGPPVPPRPATDDAHWKQMQALLNKEANLALF